jgi:hypothetical protein
MILHLDTVGRKFPPLFFSSFEQIQEFFSATAKTLGHDFYFQINSVAPVYSTYMNLYTIIFNVEDRSIAYFNSSEISVVRTPHNTKELVLSAECFNQHFSPQDTLTDIYLSDLFPWEAHFRKLEYPMMKMLWISPIDPADGYGLIKTVIGPDFLSLPFLSASAAKGAWADDSQYTVFTRKQLSSPFSVALKSLPQPKKDELNVLLANTVNEFYYEIENLTDQFHDLGNQPVELQALDVPDFEDNDEAVEINANPTILFVQGTQ